MADFGGFLTNPPNPPKFLPAKISLKIVYVAEVGFEYSCSWLYLAEKNWIKAAYFGILKKLGHSLSYPELNAVETDLANRQLKNRNIYSDAPPSLIPGMMITYVYDNCDHNPESQFSATMHCTNGIYCHSRKVSC